MARERKEKIVLQGEDRTDRAFKSAAAGLDRFAGKAKMAGLAVAAGLSAAGLAMGALGARSLKTLDSLGKAADRIGTTTEALAGLRHAGDLAGLATEKVDKAVTKMNDSLGSAKVGMEENARAFRDLGLDAERLSKLPADLAFGEIADALNKTESQADKTRIAMDIFGKSGAEALNLIAMGSAGIADAAKDADKLGLAVSRLDAAKAEAANDAMTRLGRAFEGVGNKIAVAAAPYIKLFADLLTDAMTQSGWLTKAIGWMAEHTIDGVAAIVNSWNVVGKTWALLKLGFMEFVNSKLQGLAKLESGVLELAALIPGIEPPEKSFLGEWAEESARTVKALRAETVAILTKPLPGDAIRAKFDEVNRQIADAVAASAASRQSTSAQAILGPPPSAEDIEVRVAPARSMFDQIRMLAAANDNALTEVAKAGAEERARIAEIEADRKIRAQQAGMSALSDLASLQNSQSRKMFEIGKAAAIGETVIQTYRAAQGAYAALASIPYVGPALGIAAAGAATLAGLARVKQIKSQKFGGGGSTGAGAGAGGGGGQGGHGGPRGGMDVPALAPAANDRGPARVVNLTVTGQVFTRDWLADEFMPLVNDLVGDGAEIRVAR